ncbi:MAG: type II toxin-antitoxin system RelB/DinJ family antitoxin [Firmicutes bacterium]|nr:type II toxin-antitoxin system RelB/DinJ family antitoxin [Bacillota bacterium]
MSTTNINIRIDSQTKAQAQKLFSSLGMDMSTAINIFINQSIAFGGIPFIIKQPKFNSETETAMKEANDIIEGRKPSKQYSSAEELFKELDNDA